MSVLEMAGISVTFGSVTAVQNVDLTVDRGEVHAVIGPNGAGKTTLFNAATGVVAPQSGTVRVAGRAVQRPTLDRCARQGLTRTFQHCHVFDSLTPLEHFRVANRGRSAQQVAAFAYEIARGLPNTPACELDLWGRRATEIVRALASGPVAVLLDEPAGGLDEHGRGELAYLFGEFRRIELATVVIEHDMRLVHAVCDTATVLDDGKVIRSGRPEELARDESVAAAYMGGGADGAVL
jgi:ABC-type branched-subunit amino acid transport system ATPase component